MDYYEKYLSTDKYLSPDDALISENEGIICIQKGYQSATVKTHDDALIPLEGSKNINRAFDGFHVKIKS